MLHTGTWFNLPPAHIAIILLRATVCGDAPAVYSLARFKTEGKEKTTPLGMIQELVFISSFPVA